jgi:hypothetical protein
MGGREQNVGEKVGWRLEALEAGLGKIKYIRVRIKFMFSSLRGSGTGGMVFYQLHGHSKANRRHKPIIIISQQGQ